MQEMVSYLRDVNTLFVVACGALYRRDIISFDSQVALKFVQALTKYPIKLCSSY